MFGTAKTALQKALEYGLSVFDEHQQTEAQADLAASYRSEEGIVRFVREILGANPAPYQERILRAFYKHRRVAVRSLHGAGKTALASWVILWVTAVYPTDVKVPCTASAWRQLTKFLFPEVHKWAARARWELLEITMRRGRELLDLSIKLPGKEAFAVASDNPAYIEGAHGSVVCYVLDEAKAIPDAVWDAAEGAFSTAGEETGDLAYALAISTPGDTSGRFYDIHSRKEGYEDWHVIHVSLEEAIAAGRVSRNWVERRRKQWGESSSVFQQRVLGNFAADSADLVIPLSWVEAANERWRAIMDGEAEIPAEAITTYGLDPAWTGSDKSAFLKLTGNFVEWVKYYTHVEPMNLVGKVISIMKREYRHYENDIQSLNTDLDGDEQISLVPLKRIPVGVDAIGIGAGVYSRLKEQGFQAVPVKVSEHTDMKDFADVETFINLRSAIWWLIRDWLNPDNEMNLALPPDDALTGDLTTPKWQYMSNGKIKVESKDDIRKRLDGRSTDAADALGAALFMRVRKRFLRVTVS